MSLTVGARFPDVAVHGPDGPVQLAERWAEGPLVVAFHRLWCPFCQQSALELAAREDAIAAAGGRVVLVFREDADTVQRTCRERDHGLECLSDPDRRLELAAGLRRFGVPRYAAFSPLRLVRALRAGARPGAIRTGLLQGRDTYVVDQDGRVAYVHTSRNAADIPPSDEIVAALQGPRGSRRARTSATVT